MEFLQNISSPVMMVVQGEGRGHLTQAIAVQEMLANRDIKVECVVVGSSSKREIPDFFRKHFSIPVVQLPSPNFVTDEHNRSIQIGATISKNVMLAGKYMRSLRILHRLIRFHRPSLIINFYEPLMGAYTLVYPKGPRIISIAHQYVYLHPAFKFSAGSKFEQTILRWYTKLTSIGSAAMLAISPYDLNGAASKRIRVVPPILRREVLELDAVNQGFILVYLLNDGYMDEILRWHRKHPEVRLHCFTDNCEVKKHPEGLLKIDDNLSFHALDDRKFISMMGACSGIATTAGFESVCEALYLGKPVFMVPVEGHMEQQCNAGDFLNIGAGVRHDSFDLDLFLAYLPNHNASTAAFREWAASCNHRLLKEIMPEYNQESVQLTSPFFSSFS